MVWLSDSDVAINYLSIGTFLSSWSYNMIFFSSYITLPFTRKPQELEQRFCIHSNSQHLLVLQQRLPLPVFADNSTALERILSNHAGDTDQDGQNEQDGHDDESEDPLERDDVGQELGHSDSYQKSQQSQPCREVASKLERVGSGKKE